MNRNRVVFCRLLLVACFALANAGHVAGEDRPNIIYILADDLGWGDLSCLGQAILSTPNKTFPLAKPERMEDQ